MFFAALCACDDDDDDDDDIAALAVVVCGSAAAARLLALLVFVQTSINPIHPSTNQSIIRYQKLKKGYLANGFNREVQRLEKSFQWWIVWIGGLSVIIACSSIIATAYNVMNIVCNIEEQAITGINEVNTAFTTFSGILHALRFLCVPCCCY